MTLLPARNRRASQLTISHKTHLQQQPCKSRVPSQPWRRSLQDRLFDDTVNNGWENEPAAAAAHRRETHVSLKEKRNRIPKRKIISCLTCQTEPFPFLQSDVFLGQRAGERSSFPVRKQPLGRLQGIKLAACKNLLLAPKHSWSGSHSGRAKRFHALLSELERPDEVTSDSTQERSPAAYTRATTEYYTFQFYAACTQVKTAGKEDAGKLDENEQCGAGIRKFRGGPPQIPAGHICAR